MDNEAIVNRRARKFDYSVKEELSKLLQQTKAFRIDDALSKQFSFACVVQDRLQDAIGYLDSHLDPPRSDAEFYLFMVYADNVISAVHEFFKIPIIKANVQYPFAVGNDVNKTHKFFVNAFKKAFPAVPDVDTPSDDEFFKYFRALSFAHPYETSQQKFIDQKGGERHYSPFPLTRNSPGFPVGDDGDIGVVVYSNCMGKSMSDKHFSMTLQYATIKDFLISRYDTLTGITKFIRAQLEAKEKSWLQRKIDRRKPLPTILEQLHFIYEERLEEPYYIEELVRHLETKISFGHPKNETAARKYKDALKAIVPVVCDAVDNGDYNAVARTIEGITSAEIPDWPECPNNGYRGLNYYYGNVVTCRSDSDGGWRQQIASDLSCVMKGYASKWIEIELEVMPKDEILFLLSAARLLESEECRAKGVFPRKSGIVLDMDCGNFDGSA